MSWNLPKVVEINGEQYSITKECDYRVILDCWKALKDNRLEPNEQITCALTIFYDDNTTILNSDGELLKLFIEKMIDIIDGDSNSTDTQTRKLKPIIDFEKDFPLIVSALLPILGYDIRENKYLHWWTFLGAFREINSGVYAEVLRIRTKKAKGISLDKEENKFYRENRNIIDIDFELTEDEKEFLFSD